MRQQVLRSERQSATGATKKAPGRGTRRPGVLGREGKSGAVPMAKGFRGEEGWPFGRNSM